MQIFYKDLRGRHRTLRVTSLDTTENIKVMIETSEGIPQHQQRLFFSGRQMEDGYTLYDYNIMEGDTIYLMLHKSVEIRCLGNSKTITALKTRDLLAGSFC